MRSGDLVPDFTLPDQNGVPHRLWALTADGSVVVFFYPAAMTGGCTAESCHFRDLAVEFEQVRAQRVGISADPVSTQRQFADLHSFDFPLLSDADGAVAAQFGVRRRFGPLPVKRHTFVIGTNRRIVTVVRSELRMEVHADRALQALRTVRHEGS